MTTIGQHRKRQIPKLRPIPYVTEAPLPRFTPSKRSVEENVQQMQNFFSLIGLVFIGLFYAGVAIFWLARATFRFMEKYWTQAKEGQTK